MSEWKKVNGKLCKEMSQESRDKLHAFEIMQPFRYPPLELPNAGTPIDKNIINKGIYKGMDSLARQVDVLENRLNLHIDRANKKKSPWK